MASLMVGYLAGGATWVILPALAAIDYFIRGFTSAPSPFGVFARSLVSLARLPRRPADKAPKIFAARVGFLFAACIVAMHWVSPGVAIALAVVLLVFALMEAILDICVGCLVYTYVVRPVFDGSPAQ